MKMENSASGVLASILGCLAASLLVATACRHPADRLTLQRVGYLVIGPRPAQAFGFVAGDTLREVDERFTPATVWAAARRIASEAAYDPDCVRLFSAGVGYVALLNMRCDGTVVDDGEALAGLTKDAEQRGGVIRSLSSDDYFALVPTERIAKKR